ncbi:MAG TPA: glutamate racemase [Elusimicrobia bacterium]|nr:MAG: glutamate racemase [Elusimicrobia bacterium RIFOXYA12_FULL_49_49]OGS10470.1 MAG: glutamate racemase [Elusimicrobia bacterium RIFOXYB1_FULL_48_9]OGS14693.1 MAG: glutamate racemase [Elusimicrobia bacterium RIFOXYA2_FULL_47_53]OGS25655.1 MAG: glutamate racemase [Elusimicrobia bacterium RIFOXYB12_FULL_50_12]OGS31784.1 MAG: glutamate racemase [Elusimicrobia bacterium RIFOXYB2_FULL_46_23]HBU69684.1 glutamate racemase [Elusimicrobiota bacterium]
MNKNPIGIFDSGLGGLTVMSEIIRLMPKEDIVYFGDTARVPYGSKSKEAVTRFSLEIADFLIKQKVKIIVVACNTASAFALAALQKKLNIPVIGVIVPGARAALARSKNLRIGVIGTEGTIKSESYAGELMNNNSRVRVFARPCPLFVPLVEEGWLNHAVTRDIAEEYLKPFSKNNIDTLVLGCTHYPLLKNVIGKVLGKKAALIDSATATAVEVKNILSASGQEGKSKGSYRFFVSDSPEKFKKIGQRFLKHKIKTVKKIELTGVL